MENKKTETKVFRVLFVWLESGYLNLLVDVGNGTAVHIDDLPAEASGIIHENYRITNSVIGHLIPLFTFKRTTEHDSGDGIYYELENYKMFSDKPITFNVCKDGLLECVGEVPEAFYIYPSR